jgi:hypothetical protein
LNTATRPPSPGRTTTVDVAPCRAVKLTDAVPGRVAPYGKATSRPDAVGALALNASMTAETPDDGTPARPVTGNAIVAAGPAA